MKLPRIRQDGFSLIEILVAMALVAIIFMLFPFGKESSDRDRLEMVLDNFDRAIRFASNEAILRNAMVRITIDFNNTPSSFTVEAGPNAQFVLPKNNEEEKLNQQESEYLQKQLKLVDRQFQVIADLDPNILTIDENITIIGAVQANRKIIQRENKFSFYFYPTGEKDECLIFFATFSEIAALKIGAFEQETTVDFLPIDESEKINLNSTYQAKMKELYENWVQ